MRQSAKRALTWNYGGGTQSVAIAVLIAQGRLPKPAHIIMADTSREATETWEYLTAHVQPLLATVGARVEIAPHSLATVDLYSHKGSLLPPVYTAGGGMLRIFCSWEWKSEVVRRYLRGLGYGPKKPVTTWIGISLDELGRAKPSDVLWQELDWPLLFHARMRRAACRQLVLDAGLPEPPKSSCWMCPYRRNPQWRRLRDYYPEDWERACALDEEIRAQDTQGGVYLHRSRVPLREADLTDPEPPLSSLFGEVEGCDSGFCMV